MKITIVFGVLILVSCLQLQANGAIERGRTQDCSVHPEAFRNTCHNFICDKKRGEYEIHTCGVIHFSCPEGQVPAKGTEDLTKPYPDCCAKPLCRNV